MYGENSQVKTSMLVIGILFKDCLAQKQGVIGIVPMYAVFQFVSLYSDLKEKGVHLIDSPPSHSVNASPSTLDRLVSRLGMPAGSFTAWNMAFSQTVKCPVTRPLAEEMIPSTHFSVRLELESMSLELFLWTLNPL